MPREAVTVVASVRVGGLGRPLNASVDAKNAKENSQERKERERRFLVFSLRPLRSFFAFFASTLAFNNLAKAQQP
jgi:hypothetical protein